MAFACSKANKSGSSAGKIAPDFRADDIKGEPHYLNAELKRPVILTFFATWCVPCREEISLLKKLLDKYGDKVGVLCVVTDPENKDKVIAMVKGLEIPYPMLIDEGQKIMSAYNIEALPATFLIGKDGRIRPMFKGFKEVEYNALISEIERLK